MIGIQSQVVERGCVNWRAGPPIRSGTRTNRATLTLTGLHCEIGQPTVLIDPNGELSIRADAHMIDPDDIDQRPDISRVVQRRICQMRPDTDQAPALATILACSLLMSLGRIICAMDGLFPN